MFLGTFEPNLIGKGRLALPKKIRNELGGQRIVLTVGFEKCILGFKEKDWEEVTRAELSRPLFSEKESRDLRRKMCAAAAIVQLDSQGRFVIPDNMVLFAGITDKKAIIIGAGDHFEIWEEKAWGLYSQEFVKS
jgi:MraZ protein